MCNLYSMTSNREAMLRLFRIADNRACAMIAASAIFPGYEAPVVRLADDGERELVMMNWGFVLPIDGKAPRRVTNVRDDTIQSSPFWRASFSERRCLVPASSFCEPKDERPASWHWFALTGGEARPPFAFPGIWRRYVGPVKKAGAVCELDVFAFLTTVPNALVATINHERSPVILRREEEFSTWLHGSAAEAMALARPLPEADLRIVQSGFDKLDRGIATGADQSKM